MVSGGVVNGGVVSGGVVSGGVVSGGGVSGVWSVGVWSVEVWSVGVRSVGRWSVGRVVSGGVVSGQVRSQAAGQWWSSIVGRVSENGSVRCGQWRITTATNSQRPVLPGNGGRSQSTAAQSSERTPAGGTNTI